MKSIFAALLIALLPATLVGQGAPNVRRVVQAWNWTFPTNILGLQFWVKADALALNNGDAVATWPDSSGNGRNATQAVALSQPVFTISVLNGKPVVRFDQVADQMATANFGLVQPAQYFLVSKFNQARVGNDTFFDGTSGSAVMRAFRAATNVSISAGASVAGNTTVTPESFHIHTFIFLSNPFGVLTFDAGFRTAGIHGAANAGGIVLNATGTSLAWGGQDMAELIVFSPPPSASDARRIERYLSHKYALPLQN